MAGPRALDTLRARHRWALAFGVGLVVAALLVGQQAYGQVATERVVLERPLWREEASYEYSLPVTRNATLWPIGTDLGMGQPAYYRSVSQYLHVNFTWEAEGAAPDAGAVQADMLLRLRGQDRQGRVYWEVERPIAHALGRPGEAIRVGGAVDLDEAHEEATRLIKDLPVGDGGVNWTIETRVAYALRASGEDNASVARFELPIRVNDPRLHLPPQEEVSWRTTHVSTSAATTTRALGWDGAWSEWSAQLLGLSGVALLGLGAWARGTDPGRGLPAREASFARERARFAEWITPMQGEVPTSGALLDVGSLEDLVRVAADSRARVLLHEPTRACYVVLPTMTYRYRAA